MYIYYTQNYDYYTFLLLYIVSPKQVDSTSLKQAVEAGY